VLLSCGNEMPMKQKATRLPNELADELERVAKANRMSESRLIELAVEKMLKEIRTTGKAPLDTSDLRTPAVAG